MGLPVAATIALSSVAIYTTLSTGGDEGDKKPHHIIGYVIMAVCIIQFFNGLYVWFKVYANKFAGITEHSDLNKRYFHIVI